MKKIVLMFCLLGTVAVIEAQMGSKELYAKFGAMPLSMNNENIQACINEGNLLNTALSTQLSAGFVPGSQEIYPIGKIEVGSATHLFYGVVNWYDKSTNDYAMNVACSSFKKNGEMPRGGLQNYLCMTGQDALKRESTIQVEGDKIIFTMTSTDKENKVEIEKVTYKLAGYLEFISRE
jgi:hypothetical protein